MIRLQVVGIPAPQGSKSAFVRGGRAVMVDGTSDTGRAGHQAWRQAVATAARDWLETHPQAPLAEPVYVTLHFTFPPVASDPHRFWHTTTPDVDKLIRAVFDSLTSAGLLADDRYVCGVLADKQYCATPEQVAGCEIAVSSRAEQEAAWRAHRKAQAAATRKAAKATARAAS